jgi:hypothetical protein
VISVAFWAAILAFVFPAVFCAMFHAELASARWILADKWLVVRTLAAAKPMTFGYPAGLCLELFAAPWVGALNFDAFASGNPTARL